MSANSKNVFWNQVSFLCGIVTLKIKEVLSENGFNNFSCYQMTKSETEFQELFEVLNATLHQQAGSSIQKNKTLNLAEKNEIKFIFSKMQKVNFEEFLKCNEFDQMLAQLKEKMYESPIFADEIRKILNPKQLEPFDDLIRKASSNFYRSSTGNRFDDLLLKFCISIFLMGGRKTYIFIQQNSCLPSVEEVMRLMYNEYPYYQQGVIYAKHLKHYLISNDFPLRVGIAIDDTRAKGHIVYDKTSKSLVGLKAKIDKDTGLPNFENFFVKKPSDVIQLLKEHKKAHFFQVCMAQPMKIGELNIFLLIILNMEFFLDKFLFHCKVIFV